MCPAGGVHGYVEELPKPTSSHQAVLLFLYRLFHEHLKPLGGVVMVSPLRMRIRDGKCREPDILVLRGRSDERYQYRYWLGADIVVEVVSPDNPSRDWIEKRGDYAEAGIPEYCIADPAARNHHRPCPVRRELRRTRCLRAGERAASSLLDGLRVDVAAALDATDT